MVEFEALIEMLNRLQVFTHAVVAAGGRGGIEAHLAFGCLARLNRTLHAIALLLPDGHGLEIMSLMRPVAEAATRLRWVGRDRERAQLLIDDSSLQTGVMAERWLTHGLTIPAHVEAVLASAAEVLARRALASRRDLQVPNSEMMEQRIWGRAKTPFYDLFFRRGSDDVHATAGSAARALRAETPEDCRQALHYALAATSLLLEAALHVLDRPDALVELRDLSRSLGVNWDPDLLPTSTTP